MPEGQPTEAGVRTPASETALTATMVALTMTTGVIEAVSFLVLGPVFTAVQTGNLLFLGFAIAGTEYDLSPAASGISLAGFAAGVVVGSRFEAAVQARGSRWFFAALVAEAVLLGGGAVLAWGIVEIGQPLTARHYAVTAIVAAAMGVQNVTAMKAPVPDVPTTLATRAMTGLLGEARFVLGGTASATGAGASAGAGRRRRRAASVGAMFAGGLLGAALLRASVSPAVLLLAVAAAVLGVAAVHGLLLGRRRVRMA
ncbi:YoaK family protein [Streptomyces sp. NPDC048389]|uniref:YoaK family protein n=1 Tax=Streptomyces sp. NPDC048389 TaxID=3154622 RepID=UPI00345435DE